MQDEIEEEFELVETEDILKRNNEIEKAKKTEKKKISVEDSEDVYEYRSAYKELYIEGLKKQIYNLYESNLPPVLRFMHLRDILPAGWMIIPYKRYKKNDISYCNIDISCNWKNISSAEDLPIDSGDLNKGKYNDKGGRHYF